MNPPEPFSILFCFCLMDFSLAGHVIGQAVHADVDGSDDSRDETVFVLDFNSSFLAGFEVRDCTLQLHPSGSERQPASSAGQGILSAA